MQTTIRSSLTFKGRGLHTGRKTSVTLHPASAEYGIWFRRTDVMDRDPMIAARWDAVVASELCTKVANADGVTVSTIEHIMAALAGTGISNVLIDIDGPEVPILDGSAAEFVAGILSKGVQAQTAPVRAIEILESVEVRNGSAYARLEPSAAFEIDFQIEFSEAAIGTQHKTLNMANGAFVRELCDSRTFCRHEDVKAMRARGLALGGTMENAVVIDGDEILTPGGLRHADEAVRHKMLDALGDLLLAGAPLLARYEGHKAGHAMTAALLKTLFARPEAFRIVECDSVQSARLPGAGLSRADAPALAA